MRVRYRHVRSQRWARTPHKACAESVWGTGVGRGAGSGMWRGDACLCGALVARPKRVDVESARHHEQCARGERASIVASHRQLRAMQRLLWLTFQQQHWSPRLDKDDVASLDDAEGRLAKSSFRREVDWQEHHQAEHSQTRPAWQGNPTYVSTSTG